jgi:uncharacterized membrane protein YdbT with pleckstrin-like domain
MLNLHAFNIATEKSDEQVLMIVRRHWFNILSQFIMIFAVIILIIGGNLYLPLLFPALESARYENLFGFFQNFFALVIWILFFLIWIDYYFDVWIITNKRIINVEQKGLFNRCISELNLEKIQDVTTEVVGVIPTVLNYGDVFIQTAGKTERFKFRKVSDPYHIKDFILKLQAQEEKQDARSFAQMIDGKK